MLGHVTYLLLACRRQTRPQRPVPESVWYRSRDDRSRGEEEERQRADSGTRVTSPSPLFIVAAVVTKFSSPRHRCLQITPACSQLHCTCLLFPRQLAVCFLSSPHNHLASQGKVCVGERGHCDTVHLKKIVKLMVTRQLPSEQKQKIISLWSFLWWRLREMFRVVMPPFRERSCGPTNKCRRHKTPGAVR